MGTSDIKGSVEVLGLNLKRQCEGMVISIER
jgi:hypothetical protein